MRTLAHVTHEAIQKYGGIGTVLEGLLLSDAFRDAEDRNILVSPLFSTEGGPDARLGPTGEILYSSLDGIRRHPAADAFDRVRHEFHVGIVYGHRSYTDPATGRQVSPEVILIDVAHMHRHRVNEFKAGLWEHFRIDSRRYESSWEYDLYVRLAEPALACLRALGAVKPGNECVILAHEFMGMPTALAARIHKNEPFRTIFYAHEVTTMRRIVEGHGGHDVTFYNLLDIAARENKYVDDYFGSQQDYPRHALVEASRFCDKVFAVGDDVARELRFLHPGFSKAPIDVVYNGIPHDEITLDRKLISRERLREYADILLGDRPDYVLAHVTRMAVSKGIWRDLCVLEQMERAFRQSGKTAIMFLLSTEIGPRDPKDIRRMERQWSWPVAHREVDPDLSHGEALAYQAIQEFNVRSRQIKIVLINQFGFNRRVCGDRMPAEMELLDIRRGIDVEFGQSIYEPFGIAHLEPLTYGAICAISKVSGCAGFIQRVSGGTYGDNIVVADYADLGAKPADARILLELDRDQRYLHERQVAGRVAREVLDRLPESDADRERLMTSGEALAARMSWEVVAGSFVLPGIESVCAKYPRLHVA